MRQLLFFLIFGFSLLSLLLFASDSSKFLSDCCMEKCGTQNCAEIDSIKTDLQIIESTSVQSEVARAQKRLSQICPKAVARYLLK